MGSTQYRVGTASWTDPTLLKTAFYPATARTAEARLRFYAEHFDTVEVDSSYYALPNERNAVLWAERTPDDFHFNVKAFALLTQHPAETRALPREIKAQLAPEALRELRLSYPPAEVVQLAFTMFRSALEPLRRAAKLGCILLQFPPWFTARDSSEAYIDFCRQQLPDDRLAIEFRHASWFNGHTGRTLEFLAARGLSLVCCDAPLGPNIPHFPYTATSRLAYVRLHGRNRQTWFRRTPSAAERFKYSYSDDELREASSRIRTIPGAEIAYVIFNNCYADYGVRNAATMKLLLAGGM
jgi:uncharacterized protein YecE (DUF72 family)